MADVSDVSNVLAGIVASTIYPNGTSQPGLISQKCLIYVGWPERDTLNGDLQGLVANNPNARVHVSIYPEPNELVTTKYRADQTLPQTYNAASISLGVSGNVVTLSGTVSTPQNVALLLGHANNAQPFVYAVQASDTLNTIATALATMITGATSSGPSITLPASLPVIAARSGGAGTVMQLIRRQRRNWRISVWAHHWATRDALGKPLDTALASIRFLSLPDVTSGRLVYVGSPQSDQQAPVQLYRRDFIYSVEYDTTQVFTASDVVLTQFNNDTGVSGASGSTSAVTTYQ